MNRDDKVNFSPLWFKYGFYIDVNKIKSDDAVQMAAEFNTICAYFEAVPESGMCYKMKLMSYQTALEYARTFIMMSDTYVKAGKLAGDA